MLMAYEVTRNIPVEEVEIQTPLCKTKCKSISGKNGYNPILRAGLGMVTDVKTYPHCESRSYRAVQRPRDLKPVEYYCKLPPDIEERELILLDPMLATGGSACAGIHFLKEKGAKNIKLMCLIAAPEGIDMVCLTHPDVEIYTAAVDEYLNEHAYIVPGLGDAGDRLFGTK